MTPLMAAKEKWTGVTWPPVVAGKCSKHDGPV